MGDRNWDDVAHGIRLAQDLAKREAEMQQPSSQTAESIRQLLRWVENGERIERDSADAWWWQALANKN